MFLVVAAAVTTLSACVWFRLLHQCHGVADPAAAEAPATLRARLVFAQRVEDVVTLDCIVAEAAEPERSPLPAGMPFTIMVALPEGAAWSGVAAADLLDEWAGDGRPLAVDVIDGATGAAVRLSDAATRLQLAIA